MDYEQTTTSKKSTGVLAEQPILPEGREDEGWRLVSACVTYNHETAERTFYWFWERTY